MRTTTQQSGDPVLTRRTLLGSAVIGGAVFSALGGGIARAAESPDAASRVAPAAAWQQLVDGNARFAGGKATGPRRDLARVTEVAGTQKPFAAILGCADSRVPLEIVFDQGVGDLFVVRNAGNVVTSEVIASLEYGTLVLGASVLVVCGHSACGAVKATIAGDAVPGQISALYQHIMPAVDRAGKDLDGAIHANVEIQARTLKQASPVIAGLVRDGKLAVRGGVYELASGRVVLVEV
jgi:carbonic anhydrase